MRVHPPYKRTGDIVARPFSPVLSCSKIGQPSCFSPVILYGGGVYLVKINLTSLLFFEKKLETDFHEKLSNRILPCYLHNCCLCIAVLLDGPPVIPEFRHWFNSSIIEELLICDSSNFSFISFIAFCALTPFFNWVPTSVRL